MASTLIIAAIIGYGLWVFVKYGCYGNHTAKRQYQFTGDYKKPQNGGPQQQKAIFPKA